MRKNYALLSPSLDLLRIGNFEDYTITPLDIVDRDNPYWVPYTRSFYDNSGGNAYTYETTVYTITTNTVSANIITEAKSTFQLRIENEIFVDSLINERRFKAIALGLFELVNMVRDLQGNSSITLNQFRNYIINIVNQQT